MTYLYRRSLFWKAMDELTALRAWSARTGEDLRALVEIPPDVRDAIDRYLAANPDDRDVRDAIIMRDLMLERIP